MPESFISLFSGNGSSDLYSPVMVMPAISSGSISLLSCCLLLSSCGTGTASAAGCSSKAKTSGVSPRLFFPRAFKASTKRTTSLPSPEATPAPFPDFWKTTLRFGSICSAKSASCAYSSRNASSSNPPPLFENGLSSSQVPATLLRKANNSLPVTIIRQIIMRIKRMTVVATVSKRGTSKNTSIPPRIPPPLFPSADTVKNCPSFRSAS